MSYIVNKDDPNIQKFFTKINNLVDSMNILFDKDKNEPGLMLFYCLIDQFSWLSCEKEFSNSSDFKLWVKEYFDVKLLNCNEEDLWNHRCSLSHMGTSQSMQYKADKHYQLGFYKNLIFNEIELKEEQSKYASPTKLVDLGKLTIELNKAVEEFLWNLIHDHELRNRVFKKIDKMTNTFLIS